MASSDKREAVGDEPGESADELIRGADPPPEPADDEDLNRAKKRSDLGVRKRVGNGALLAMGVQIAVADAVFFVYGHANEWDIPVSAIHAWLGATVVQVVSVVLVITRYLFPAGGDPSNG